MGMVPIMLALLGFTLLWSMVTYSSLSNKYNRGMALKAEAKMFYEKRNALYTALSQRSMPHLFEEADLSLHQRMISEINEFINEQQKHPSSSTQALADANVAFAETYNAYLQQTRGYNHLITEKPFSFLASICKMQPLG